MVFTIIAQLVYNFHKKIQFHIEVPKKLWIQFETKEDYLKSDSELMEMIRESDGNDRVIIYIKGSKEKKVLPPNLSVLAGKELVDILSEKFGEENVKVTL